MKGIETVIQMKVEDIIPYDNNPRVNDLAVGVVADSIREFGFKSPIIVDKNNIVIAGHTRLKASKRLGLEVVPVVVADDLSAEQVKAFRIMDNKSGEFAEWDYVKLLEEVGELDNSDYDVNLTGFDEIELGEIMDKMSELAEEKEEKEKPELEFTEELLEEHQYVVLYFDNTLDWQVAKDVFDIRPAKALDSREGYERVGMGRVVRGDKYLEMIKAGKEVGEF